VEVLTRLTFVTILPQASFLAGMNEATRVGEKDVSKLFFFLRTGTHVISRSPGSRDERALRAPLKATPDSKQRSSPPLLLLLNYRCSSLSLSVLFLSSFLSPLPACHSISLSLFLSYLLYLSQNSISTLSHCLSYSIFAFHLSLIFLPFNALLAHKIPSPRHYRLRRILNFG